MKSIEYLYDLVGKSCFTTIGYSSIYERINVKFPNIDSMARYLRLKETLENLRSVGIENNIKVIFTSPIYRLSEDYTIKGGSSPIYVADLVLVLNGDNCKISKNRFGEINQTISLSRL
jgi:hypothetical protein